MHIKPLDNFHPDGLVFKTTWGFFNILIGCFATCLSSLLFKILPILLTMQVIVEIHFSSFFWVGILGVFELNFKAIGKVYIPYKFVQRRHICIKTKKVFFNFQIFPNNLHLWWLPVKICQHSEKLEIPMPIQLNRSILQSLGRLSIEDCLKPLSNSVRFFHQSISNFLTFFLLSPIDSSPFYLSPFTF